MSLDRLEMGVTARLGSRWRDDPALRIAIEKEISQTRQRITTDQEASRTDHYVGEIIERARTRVFEEGDVLHQAARRAGYFGNSATLDDDRAIAHRNGKRAKIEADAKAKAHANLNKPAGYEGETRNLGNFEPDPRGFYGDPRKYPTRKFPWQER